MPEIFCDNDFCEDKEKTDKIIKEINDFIEGKINGLNVYMALRILEQVGEDVNEAYNVLELEIMGHNEESAI